MYRIRFQGRVGQGMRTASRILGSAFYAEGFEIQDAPQFGARCPITILPATFTATESACNRRGRMNRCKGKGEIRAAE